MDREAVRRAARPGPELEGLVRGAARPLAQFPVQLSRPQRRQRRKPGSRPTAPTSSISCAPISPSRWGCRSAIRIARAVSAAGRRNAISGSTSSIPKSRARRRRPNRMRSAGSGCPARPAAAADAELAAFVRPIRAAGSEPCRNAACESRRRPSRNARPISANICATSATSCIPARCAPATTTPISTSCR